MELNDQSLYLKQENNDDFVKREPLTKALSDARISETDLPFEVKTNPELLRKCKEREATIKELHSVYTKIPTLTTIDQALEKDLLQFEEAESFYRSIIDLIENDRGSDRLLLYFPIELIPSSKNEKLKFFTAFYKSEWKELLKEIDVREGFNIGDVPEVELRNGPLAKVSKAAHLIPSLVEKGIINKTEVFDILENETDETITESILDTVRILFDKKYIDSTDIDELEKSKKIGVRNMVSMIRYDQNTQKEHGADQEQKILSTKEVFDSMNLELASIESSIRDTGPLPEARVKWLMNSEKEKILEKYSKIVYTKINDNEAEVDKLLEDTDAPEHSVMLIQALEKLLLKNPTNDKFSATLSRFMKSSDIDIKNAFLNTLNRLDSAGVLNETYFSKNDLEKEEVEIEKSVEGKVKNVLSNIEADPLLADSVYPTAILYGSHVKGYGKENSDTDIGVFIKETVSFDKHEEIKSTFNKILEDSHINGSVMEFWLKKDAGASVWIQDFENPDNSLGDSLITSPLTGVWYGEEKTIQTLQAELLPNYLYSEDKQLFGFDARKLWLKDMERNLIQYRLLHKGYKEKNLPQGGINSLYKHEIDGDSMFYDSGFRRLATKIYLEKVFLPQLKKG